jgi:CDP-glucose 4,6-dehydratase
MKDRYYWQGKNVFITGVNGFIGSNLAKYLVESGAIVTGLIRNLDEDSLLYIEGIAPQIKIVQGELVDKEVLRRIIVEEQIQYIFHLAAQVEVGLAREYPYLTWETNIRGTYCLLESVRENSGNIEAVVIASSDKAYGQYGRNKMPYKEDYPLIPMYPYDVSKACADMIARSYSTDLYSLPVIVTRFCNIYGPGQLNFSAVIPDATRCALGYGDFIPRSDGSQIRDYIYVEDVVQLYAVIAERLSQTSSLGGEVFNAGTNEPRRIREIVEMVFKMTGRDEKYKEIDKLWAKKKTIGEIEYQYMDFEKVNKYFGWKPGTDFNAGIGKTIEWYKKYFSSKKGLNE